MYKLQQLLSSDRELTVRAYVQESGNTRALPCGVYGDEKTYTPSLDITAVGIVSDNNETFLALTISLAVGQHESHTDAYGRKKVVVAINDGNDEPLLEKVYNVIPRANSKTTPSKASSPRHPTLGEFAASPPVVTVPAIPDIPQTALSTEAEEEDVIPAKNRPPSLTHNAITIEGRRLATRRHRDFIARQRSDSVGAGGGAGQRSGYEMDAGDWGDALVDASEIYMTEVPEGHEVTMTISPFLSSKAGVGVGGVGGANQDLYVRRSGSSGGDGYGSRYDTLALHYDATLLAGCYQLDSTHVAERDMQADKDTSARPHEPPETFEIGSTRTFVRSQLVQKTRTVLLLSMKTQDGRPRMLTSGVYGPPRGPRPPIDLTAVAIYSSQGELFVSLSVHATSGNERNPDVLGIRKFVVFTGDGGMPILERIFNIVPQQGTEREYVRSGVGEGAEEEEEVGEVGEEEVEEVEEGGEGGQATAVKEETPIIPRLSLLKPMATIPPVPIPISPSSSYVPQPWETLIWHTGQSREVVEATAAAGMELLRALPPPAARDPWAFVPKDYGDFEEGRTKIFRLNSMVNDRRGEVVEQMVVANGGPGAGAQLLGGSYMLSEMPNPPLDITAVALMEEGTEDIYVAVTITGTEKGLGTFTEKGVYGGKRVVIMSRPGEPPLLEKVFNIVRRKDGSSSPLRTSTSTQRSSLDSSQPPVQLQPPMDGRRPTSLQQQQQQQQLQQGGQGMGGEMYMQPGENAVMSNLGMGSINMQGGSAYQEQGSPVRSNSMNGGGGGVSQQQQQQQQQQYQQQQYQQQQYQQQQYQQQQYQQQQQPQQYQQQQQQQSTYPNNRPL